MVGNRRFIQNLGSVNRNTGQMSPYECVCFIRHCRKIREVSLIEQICRTKFRDIALFLIRDLPEAKSDKSFVHSQTISRKIKSILSQGTSEFCENGRWKFLGNDPSSSIGIIYQTSKLWPVCNDSVTPFRKLCSFLH